MKLKKLILPLGVLALLAIRHYKRRVATPYIPGFDLNRYLGKWYEIARLDFRFESRLDFVTAEYSLNDDGTVKVVNRGYNSELGMWESVEGQAVPDGYANHFKVYFNPLIGAPYRVVYVSDDYSLAVVAGRSKKYFWILSRTPYVSLGDLADALEIMDSMGYDSTKLVFPEQA